MRSVLEIWVPTVKTTVEISDELANEARAFAARENVTLRALIERGLRLALHPRNQNDEFRLRDASVGGRGLQPPFCDSDWARIRDAAYEGRGS